MKDDIKELIEIINGGFQGVQDQLNDIKIQLRECVTKEEAKNFLTKEDGKKFATKEDLKNFATKDDLKNFATKDDLKNFITKDDAKNFATKSDINQILHVLTTKADRSEVAELRNLITFSLLDRKCESNMTRVA